MRPDKVRAAQIKRPGTTMARVLKIAFLTLLVAAAIVVGTAYFAAERARAFSEKAVRKIFTDWDYAASRPILMERMRLSSRANSEGPIFLQWGKEGLGPLQESSKPFGGVALGWEKGSETYSLFGDYEFKARFKNGEAYLSIGVVWEDWAWRVSSYKFDSPVLHDPPRIKPAGDS
jgi:hypothetical protein